MFLMLTEPASKSVNPIIANTSVAQYKKNTASTLCVHVTCMPTEVARQRDARRAVPRRGRHGPSTHVAFRTRTVYS